METIYETIKKNALPIMAVHQADLTLCDKDAITDNPEIPFIHFTWNSGTFLILLYPPDHETWPKNGEKIPYLFGHADREQILQQHREVLPEIKQNDVKLIQVYTGNKVKTISMEQAETSLQNYVSSIMKLQENT